MNSAGLPNKQAKADEAMRRDWKVENGLLVFDGTGYDNICTECRNHTATSRCTDWMRPDGKEPDAGIYLRGTPQQMWIRRVSTSRASRIGGLYNNQTHPCNRSPWQTPSWQCNTMYIKNGGRPRDCQTEFRYLVVDNIVMENYWDRSQPVPALEQIELQAHGSKVYYRKHLRS